jgi:alanine racemase
MSSRPTWAEISLPALRHNFELIRDFVASQATVCAVVKCDAYGHGAVECARALEQSGAKWFGVTCADEGIALRRAGISGRILLMSGIWRGEAEAVVEHELTPAVWNEEQVQALAHAAEKVGNKPFPLHVEVDTGMARQGVLPKNLPALLAAIQRAKSLKLEGVHSHLASSEVVDAPDVGRQIARYQQALQEVASVGLHPECFHLANSAAVITQTSTWRERGSGYARLNLVRPGISLYGYFLPFLSIAGAPQAVRELPVQPVLAWKTRIIDLRRVNAGQAIGYNGSYVTSAPASIATLAVGYGDGLNRRLSSLGRVLVRGEFAAIVGKVSMDVTTIDVTQIAGAEIGDEVVLIGEQGRRKITAWEMAREIETIPYDVLCAIGKRVPRRYSS